MTDGEAAAELQKVARALDQTQLLVSGLDRCIAAVNLHTEVRYSGLRTLVEQAQEACNRVIEHLRGSRT